MSNRSKKAKILLFDIETSPNLAYVWGRYEQNVLDYEKEWEIICFAWKWLGEKKIYDISMRGKRDDRTVVQKLWKLFDQADIVIAHNGDKFDQKKARARFLYHGMTPPSSHQSIDTVKVSRRYFNFNSNKLDELGRHLGLGRKVHTGGFQLWLGCMQNDSKAWKKMIKYNRKDVSLLEKVYLKLRPWMDIHPNRAVIEERPDACPKCGGKRLQSRGIQKTRTQAYRQFQCQSCGGWCRSRVRMKGYAPDKV